MKDTFTIELVAKEGNVSKDVNRQSFLALMESIKMQFIYNNEFSKKFITIIPQVEEIKINNIRNSQLDVPFIQYVINGKEAILRIPRNHKIIWGILFECCK